MTNQITPATLIQNLVAAAAPLRLWCEPRLLEERQRVGAMEQRDAPIKEACDRFDAAVAAATARDWPPIKDGDTVCIMHGDTVVFEGPFAPLRGRPFNTFPAIIDEGRLLEIADETVPQYRDGKRSYPCHGTVAKRWEAAYQGARIALYGEGK